MENKLPRVLVISSLDPNVGPGVVGYEHYNALRKYGIDTDFLTKYPVKGHSEFLYVCKNRPKRSLIGRTINFVNKLLLGCYMGKMATGHCFFYKKEVSPPVPIKKVLKCIERQYDVVYVLFWQELLSFATIDAIYEKLHCQIHFRCADYSPVAGGCHFLSDCQRYKTGCGMCPGIYSKKLNDFTRWNVGYRKKIYEKVKPIVYGNTYMHSFYRKSYLLKEYDRMELVYPVMDNAKYQPLDMVECRKQYDIPNDKFVIFFGCQYLNDERKGFCYLLKALKTLHDTISLEEREMIYLLLAGNNIDAIKDNLPFDYRHLGYVNQSELPVVYSMSNVYLCPSVNDAGPSMVNQSMSCGTPIVAFEMGTALDVVKDKGTGYCAKLRDADDFAKGIEMIFKMSNNDYNKLRTNCRTVATKLTSEEAFVEKFLSVCRKYGC